MKEKTIVALATPLGTGALCIIRLSGQDSLLVAKKIFSAKKLNFDMIQPKFAYLGEIKSGYIMEKCIMIYFKSPNSYTGEDSIEFYCHGGELLAEKIIQLCIDNKAQLALPGEFSKRAFMNGKISLDQAEGVIDVINAQSESELRAAFSLVDGELYKVVFECQEKLTEVLAEINVALDYPEHDIEYQTVQNTKKLIKNTQNYINGLLINAKNSKIIKNGVNIAIIGKPNVGKSSLLNALIGEERAIVTDIEGTTRDTIKETVVYKGIKYNFIDTAGLRNSEQIIEQLGIERTKKIIETADIILFVLDYSNEINEEEKEYLKVIKNKNFIIIINKIDKKQQILLNFDDFLLISAKNKKNINKIYEKVYEKIIEKQINFNSIILTNTRHITALKKANKILETVYKTANNSTLDIIALQIKQAWDELGKITGQTENEKVIDAIFSKFCLGK